MLDHIPLISTNKHDVIVRFIHLVDIFYDQQRLLIVSAAAPIVQLYTGIKSAFAFKRTCSRLQEMQDENYITNRLRSCDRRQKRLA